MEKVSGGVSHLFWIPESALWEVMDETLREKRDVVKTNEAKWAEF